MQTETEERVECKLNLRVDLRGKFVPNCTERHEGRQWMDVLMETKIKLYTPHFITND